MMGRYPHLSPFTNLKPADFEAINRALAQTGMEALRHRPMNTLSGGERQMAFIAGALAQGAQILLLDEPTTFLDYRHQSEIMRILKTVSRESGITIVAVHHDINMAADNSNRIYALKNGRVVFSGTPEEITDKQTLENIYGTGFYCIPSAHRSYPYIIPAGRTT